MSRKDFYVYVLLDTRKPGKYRYGKWSFDFEPFYVGKGHDKRVTVHFRPTHNRNALRAM